MLARAQMGSDAGGEVRCVPPVQHADRRRFRHAADQRVVAQRGDEMRPMLAGETLEGAEIHMVVVIMGDQHDINRRQIGEGNARLVDPPRAEQAERAGTAGPDRIDQQVQPGQLNKKTGMADGGDTQTLYPRRWTILKRAGGLLGPARAPTLPPPTQQVGAGFVAGDAWEEKPLAVEMIRCRTGVIGVAHSADGGSVKGRAEGSSPFLKKRSKKLFRLWFRADPSTGDCTAKPRN